MADEKIRIGLVVDGQFLAMRVLAMPGHLRGKEIIISGNTKATLY